MKTLTLALAIVNTIMAFRIGTTADVTVFSMDFARFCIYCLLAAYLFIISREA